MTTETQKEVARSLDRMAERCIGRGKTPASGKQCWFLAKLLIEDARWAYHGLNSVHGGSTDYALSSAEASRLIGDLLADQKKAA